MAKTIAFISGSGGTGKTTTCLLMAHVLQAAGKKVLVIDCDPTSCGLTEVYRKVSDFGPEHFPACDLFVTSIIPSNVCKVTKNLSFVYCEKLSTDPVRGRANQLKRNLDALLKEGKYEFILIDCPGGINEYTSVVSDYYDEAKHLMPCDHFLLFSHHNEASPKAASNLVESLTEEHNETWKAQFSQQTTEVCNRVSKGHLEKNDGGRMMLPESSEINEMYKRTKSRVAYYKLFEKYPSHRHYKKLVEIIRKIDETVSMSNYMKFAKNGNDIDPQYIDKALRNKLSFIFVTLLCLTIAICGSGWIILAQRRLRWLEMVVFLFLGVSLLFQLIILVDFRYKRKRLGGDD